MVMVIRPAWAFLRRAGIDAAMPPGQRVRIHAKIKSGVWWDPFLVVVTSPAWGRPSPKVRDGVRCMRKNARGAYPGKHSRAPQKLQAHWVTTKATPTSGVGKTNCSAPGAIPKIASERRLKARADCTA